MIDLHLHTTASDGRCTPEELVRRAWLAGIRTLSVTDHDTTAAVAAVETAVSAYALECVPGIEITAVLDARDVHVLGYFLDPAAPGLLEFLVAQRQDRVRRAREIAAQLEHLGHPVDISALIDVARVDWGQSIGRPQIAAALVAAGHTLSVHEAFERLLGMGRPAYIPRRGVPPEEVVGIIKAAGGVASLAHPGLLERDELLPRLVDAGLGALEVYHCDHDKRSQAHYLKLARRYDLAVTGGSDYHGESGHRRGTLGAVTLPAEEFDRLRERARGRA